MRASGVARRTSQASAEPGMLRADKRLIDTGLGLPLGEAMALEAQRSKAWAAAQTPGLGVSSTYVRFP